MGAAIYITFPHICGFSYFWWGGTWILEPPWILGVPVYVHVCIYIPLTEIETRKTVMVQYQRNKAKD